MTQRPTPGDRTSQVTAATAPRRAPRLVVGMVVYDRRVEMPATVVGFDGPFVCLMRPTGLAWRSRIASVRPANTWERRQLRAVATLYARARRPPGPARPPPQPSLDDPSNVAGREAPGTGRPTPPRTRAPAAFRNR